MTMTEFGGGVEIPNIPTNNEEKKKIVRLMKPIRRRA
jgi:hypothetical protein